MSTPAARERKRLYMEQYNKQYYEKNKDRISQRAQVNYQLKKMPMEPLPPILPEPQKEYEVYTQGIRVNVTL